MKCRNIGCHEHLSSSSHFAFPVIPHPLPCSSTWQYTGHILPQECAWAAWRGVGHRGEVKGGKEMRGSGSDTSDACKAWEKFREQGQDMD